MNSNIESLKQSKEATIDIISLAAFRALLKHGDKPGTVCVKDSEILTFADVTYWRKIAAPSSVLVFSLCSYDKAEIGTIEIVANEAKALDPMMILTNISEDLSIRSDIGFKVPKGVVGNIYLKNALASLPYKGVITNRGLYLHFDEKENVKYLYEVAISYFVPEKKAKVFWKNETLIILIENTENKYEDDELRSAIENLLSDDNVVTKYIIRSEALSDIEQQWFGKENNISVENNKKRKELINIEQHLIRIFDDLLFTNNIKLSDNFFDIGGNSLIAIQLISKINKDLKIKLQFKDLFRYPVISDLARLINQKEKINYADIKKAGEQDSYPLSVAQLRLWILSQTQEASVAYNEFNAFKISGKLDTGLLNKALYTLVHRHEILRTVFRTVADIPRQFILDTDTLELSVKTVAIGQRDSSVENMLIEESRHIFDMENGPLLRVLVLKENEQQQIVCVNMHHIISDGWSQVIFFNELIQLYYGLINNAEVKLPELKIQFKDYAAWHNDFLQTDKIKPLKVYWSERLAGRSPKVDLSAFQKVKPKSSFKGKLKRYELEKKYLEGFQKIARQTNSTVFSVILTYFNVLLYKYSGQKDIIVGTSVAGRNHYDLENQIGFYVNTIPLRNKLNPANTFVDQLNDITIDLLNDYDNYVYPFHNIVTDIQLESEENGVNPLFDVFIEYFNYRERLITDDKATGTTGLRISPLSHDNQTSIFGLNIMFIEGIDELSVEVRFDALQFDEGKVDSLIEHFKLLIDLVTARPDNSIASYEILLPWEIKKLAEFGNTARDLPVKGTVMEMIEKHVRLTPNDDAIFHEDQSMTYNELWRISNQIANFLIDNNKETQYKVGVLMHRSCFTLASLLGIWKAGAIYIPLDPEFPDSRLKYIIDDSGAIVLFTDKEAVKQANKLQWECASLKNIVLLDGKEIQGVVEDITESEVELWEYFGEKAQNDIEGGGWYNSYTSEPFSREEMDEYRDNAVSKLLPYINCNTRILEIGCASGITMFALADKVKEYVGIDLSATIISRNKAICKERKINNISLCKLMAHQIDLLAEDDFDIIIINSVIQSFNGHNYLRNVLNKSFDKLNKQGIFFLGDLIDQELKSDLLEDLRAFKRKNPHAKTKMEFNEELFISRTFLQNYAYTKDFAIDINFLDKTGSIENELKRFRFDAIFEIDKTAKAKKNKLEDVRLQFDRAHIESYNELRNPDLTRLDDISYIIYTSGSTGKPKGAIVEHRGMLNHLDAKRNDLQLNKNSRIVQNSSQCFDISIWQFVNALMVGGSTYVYSNDVVMEPSILLHKIKSDRISIFEVVPSYMQVLLDNNDASLGNPLEGLVYFLVNGETLKPKLVAQWFSEYPSVPLVNCYGPTEASDDVTHYFMYEHKDDDLKIPIGVKPIQNFIIHILDNEYNRVPIGAKGEICVSGFAVGRGYVNDPVKTQKAFMPDPIFPERKLYKTGDIGRVSINGTIDFFGRKDTQVKVRGYRIELEEIEICLTKIKGVKNACLLVGQDSKGINFLNAFVILSDEHLTADLIKESLKCELPEYMVPNVIHFLGEFPLNHNGKTDRKALKKMISGDSIKRTADFVAPIGDTEKRLAKIWEEVLSIQPVGRGDGFFEIGGHSVAAIQAISKIKNAYEINFPLKELFENTTIAELANRISVYQNQKTELVILAPGKKVTKYRYKISPVQYAEWYLQKLNANSTFYNIGFILELTGEVNYTAFFKTLAFLFKRHDMFKFTIVEDNGIPYQVLKEESVLLPENIFTDYTHLKDDEINLQEIIENNFNTIFDFEQGIFNIKLIKLKDQRHIFIFETHHIAWDQLSTLIFYREFLQTYNTTSKGGQPELPAITVNYSDYTEWINNLIDSGKLEKQRNYWLDRYKTIPPSLELPTDYPRPLVHTFNGRFIAQIVDRAFKDRITMFCNDNDVTYQIFLISVLNLLLYRLTGQEDFVVGTPIWNRDKEHLDKILGLFASGIPVRCTLGSEWTFDDLLAHTKESSLGAYENHLYPFNKIIEELNPVSDFSRQKVISVFFGVQMDETELTEGKLDGIEIRDISDSINLAVKNTSVFDFTLQVDHNKDRMQFTLRYNTDLFKKETAENFLTRYRYLVEECMTTPGMNLLDYQLLTKEEEKIIDEASVSKIRFKIPDLGIHDVILKQAKSNEEKVAIIEGNDTFLYKDLITYVNKISVLLHENGIDNQEKVGILLPKSINFIASVLGVMNSGGVFVPISNEYPVNRIEEIVSQAGIRKIITQHSFLKKAYLNTSFTDKLIDLSDIDFSKISSKAPKVKVGKEDLAYTIFTSGSTGKPKGIEIKHGGVYNIIKSTIEDFNFTDDEVVLFHTPTVFDASIMDYLWPLVGGAGIVVMEEEEEKSILNYEKLINKHNITHLQSVPLLLESIVDGIERKEIQLMKSLKRVVVGGAILNASLKNRFLRQFNIDLHNCYGPTETTVDSTRHRCSLDDIVSRNFVPIGKPVANTKLYILDKNLRRTPIGVPGELYISTVGTAKGYLNDKERTEKTFIKNIFNDGFSDFLYKTGDKAALIEGNNFVVYGRLDNQIKLNGNRIEIDEIESLLLESQDLFNAGVILSKQSAYEQLVAFVEPEKDVNTINIPNGEKLRILSLYDNNTFKSAFETLVLSIPDQNKNELLEIILDNPQYQLCFIKNNKLVAATVAIPVFFEAELKAKNVTCAELIEASRNANENNALVILKFTKNNGLSIAPDLETLAKVYASFTNIDQSNIFKNTGSGHQMRLAEIKTDGNVLNLKLTNKDKINTYLSDFLPQYMIPNSIVVQDKIALNTNGKVDKSKLKEIKLNKSTSGKVELSPVQKKLEHIFKEVLNIDQVYAYDSFFEIGGHSINMIQLIAKIENEFKVKIPIINIFKLQSVYNIGNYLDKLSSNPVSEVYLQQLTFNGKKNIICFPSIATTAADFLELAKLFKDYNVYAFDFSLLDEFNDIYTDRHAIIRKCMDLITAKNIKGHYDILGYSAGSLIAYEMLKTTADLNCVDNLLVLDIAPPSASDTVKKSKVYEDADVDAFLSLDQLQNFNSDEKEIFTKRIWKYAELASYVRGTQALDLPFHIFSSNEADLKKQKSWKNLSKGKITFTKLKGSHYDILKKGFIEDNVKKIVNKLA